MMNSFPDSRFDFSFRHDSRESSPNWCLEPVRPSANKGLHVADVLGSSSEYICRRESFAIDECRGE